MHLLTNFLARFVLVMSVGAADVVGKGSFVPAGDMTIPRIGHTATLLPDGKVLIAGGATSGEPRPSPTATAELYDPATGTFGLTGTMTVPRTNHTATLLPDGTVLIVGGGTPRPTYCCAALDSAELYHPQSETFTPVSPMTTGRIMHDATLLPTGQVLVTGGVGESGLDNRSHTAEVYDPVTRSFRPSGPMSASRYLHTAALLFDGTVLVAGGISTDDAAVLFVERYNPELGVFRKAGAINGPVYSDGPAVLSSLADGRVLMVLEAWGRQPTTATSVYNPVTLQFTAAGSLHGVRVSPASTLLRDGRVLVTGVAFGFKTPDAEIFDPDTGEFSAEGPVLHQRLFHTATLLADGSVLLAGGWKERYGGEILASAELYRPEEVVHAIGNQYNEALP
jgi:hypothetical protein